MRKGVALEGDGGEWVQLATRLPKRLHRALKLHCVVTEQTVMGFVVAALREKLGRRRKSA